MTDRKNEAHKAFIRTLPCAVCGADKSECAHVRMPYWGTVTVPTHERGGQGMKPADCWCVPLCRSHHQKQHDAGERRFWEATFINPLALAQALYQNTGKRDVCLGILYRARNGQPL